MRVKPVDPNAVVIDPVTKARLPVEGDERPDNLYWNARLAAKEVELCDASDAPAPTGREPVQPLTTREAK